MHCLSCPPACPPACLPACLHRWLSMSMPRCSFSLPSTANQTAAPPNTRPPSCLIACSVGALPNSDYWKIGAYFGGVLAVYLLFSLPMSYIKHSQIDYVNTEELK